MRRLVFLLLCFASGCSSSLPLVTSPDAMFLQSTFPVGDPWNRRIPGIGIGIHDTVVNGPYTDFFIQNPQHTLALAIRPAWGGGIIYFGVGTSNIIDGADPGRLVQPAFYDAARFWQDCAANSSCVQEAYPHSCSLLGWNPVQGGDGCGRGSSASYRLVAGVLKITAHPVQWIPSWDAGGCSLSCGASAVTTNETFEIELRWIHERVIEMAIESHNTDTYDHTGTPIFFGGFENGGGAEPISQEWPAVYAHADLVRVVDSAGTSLPFPPPFALSTSPLPWISYQKADLSLGLGIYTDQGIKRFFIDGGADSFHYFRPWIPFSIPHGSTQRGITYLAYGSHAQIAAAFAEIAAKRPPFGKVEVTMTPSSGAVRVKGWVLDTAHIATVDVKVNKNTAVSVAVDQTRNDICGLYPGYDGCPTVGFDQTITVPALTYGVQVSARDADGNVSVIGRYFNP